MNFQYQQTVKVSTKSSGFYTKVSPKVSPNVQVKVFSEGSGIKVSAKVSTTVSAKILVKVSSKV